MSEKKHKIAVVDSEDVSRLGHRADFSTCPHCDKKPGSESKYGEHSEAWRAAAVRVILNPSAYRASSVAFVSVCPSCQMESWVHECTSSFERTLGDSAWPENVRKKVEAFSAGKRVKEMRKFGASLCCGCRHLQDATFNYDYVRIECSPVRDGGYHKRSGTCCMEGQCAEYKPLAKPIAKQENPT